MADEATQATDVAPAEVAAAPATENTEEPTSTESNTDSQSTDESKPDEASGKTDEVKPPASSGDTEQSKTQDPKPESKPLSRRSAAYRIQELVKENKALKEQQNPAPQAEDWETPQAEPDINKLVNEAIEKRLNPIISESSKAADDAEINEVLAGNPDRPKYEGQIRKLWNLPQYKDVAALDIYNMLRGKEMDTALNLAREQAVEAFKKAGLEATEASASGSSSNRTGKTGEKSAWDLSDKEFEAQVNKARSG